MRSIVFALALSALAVGAAQAQQLVTSTPAEQSELRPAVVASASVEVDRTPTQVEAIQPRNVAAAEVAPPIDNQTRNILAVIGAVVVVVAVIAFLN